MNLSQRRCRSSAFTLIELLIVIAIIAILAVVVVLALNPAQLLAQSRDANRVSDMATLNTAIGLYAADQGGIGSMGTSTFIYASLADNTSSTCGSLGLPTPPTGSIYDCSPATSTRLINTLGWIPIDFTKISAGSPLGSFPLDPVNSSSSGLYYTYNTTSSQFMVSAIPESTKQKLALAKNPMISNYPDVIANGSSLTISPFFNPQGLVGYWPMDEGNGSTTIDTSGNGNTANFVGSTTAGSYFGAGKVGVFGGVFNGTNTTANVTSTSGIILQDYSFLEWANCPSIPATSNRRISIIYGGSTSTAMIVYATTGYFGVIEYNGSQVGAGGTTNICDGIWHLLGVTRVGTAAKVYFDGAVVGMFSDNAFLVL